MSESQLRTNYYGSTWCCILHSIYILYTKKYRTRVMRFAYGSSCREGFATQNIRIKESRILSWEIKTLGGKNRSPWSDSCASSASKLILSLHILIQANIQIITIVDTVFKLNKLTSYHVSSLSVGLSHETTLRGCQLLYNLFKQADACLRQSGTSRPLYISAFTALLSTQAHPFEEYLAIEKLRFEARRELWYIWAALRW